MHPLGQLITERMEHPDNRWSLNDVVDRAAARGEKLGRSNLARLRAEMTPHLSLATICGLAAGLGVTPLTVANAALRSWGIEPIATESTDSIETVRIDPSLGERQREQLEVLIRQMRSAGDITPPHQVQDLPLGRTRIIGKSATGKGAARGGDQQRGKRHELGGR